MSPIDPSRRPEVPAGPPRWLLVLLSAGISLLVAALLLAALSAFGVEALGPLGFVVLLVVAAVAGGWATRQLAPRLPPFGRSRS